jgi:crotonobetainyl-CoA:carnitine CoA-transferase CaiB-like acyl-CoA transferase
MAEQALSHLRVIDLTHYISGPYCTKLMAGFGADVIKIERPGTGDKMRSIGPFYENEEGQERSIPFLWLNTGKKSITLNLKTEKGIEIFKRLLQGADVVVENFSPRVMPGLGLSYETLREINPRLVMASISNFGQTGPYKYYTADEIELNAMSGVMYVTGASDKPPLTSGPAMCQYSAGLHAYTGILMSLFQREATGQGQYLDISIMECGLEHIENRLTDFLQIGKNSKRGSHLFSPWGLYTCEDGYVAVIGAPFRHWTRGAEIFDEPRLLEGKYRHVRDRAQFREEVDALIQPWVSKHKKKEILQKALEHNLAFGYLPTFDEVLESPQHKARDFFAEIDHPAVGKHKYCGPPFKMSQTPWVSLRAPLLGEHNQAVYGDLLAYSTKEIHRLREEGVI